MPVISEVADNGHLIEVVKRPETDRVQLAIWDGHRARLLDRYAGEDGKRYVPSSLAAALCRHDVLKLASEAAEYGTTSDLIDAILAYLRRYVELSEGFARVAATYVLLSWVYDRFNELPYLRRRGDYGTGKTRFLITLGSICYKPIFAGGASTVSPLFHLLDQVGGTLIIDEADFRFSDESALIAKILNNGNVRGFSVLRSESVNGKDFRPRAFRIFGPKLVAMRGRYDDPALESRFLTETTSPQPINASIPINLPSAQEAEALILRNKLLMYRFRTFADVGEVADIAEAQHLEARLRQILGPLLAVAPDETSRQAILAHGEAAQSAIAHQRCASLEAELLAVVRYLFAEAKGRGPSVSDIARTHHEAFGEGGRQPMSARATGAILRTKLNLSTRKSHGVYVVPREQEGALAHLYALYGVTTEDVERIRETQPGSLTRVDYGDMGDVRSC